MLQAISTSFEGTPAHNILQNPESKLLLEIYNPEVVEELTNSWVYNENLDKHRRNTISQAYQENGYNALTENYDDIITQEIKRRQGLLLNSFLKEKNPTPQTIVNYIHLLLSSGYHELCSDGLGYHNFNLDLNQDFLNAIQERNSDLHTHDWWSAKAQELITKNPELSDNPDKLNQTLQHLALTLKLNDFNGAANWYQVSLSESGEKLLKLIFENHSDKIHSALQEYLVWTNSKIIADYPDLANKMLNPQKKFEYCNLLTNICVLLFSSKTQNLFPIADYLNTTTANWIPDKDKEMFGGEGSLTTVITNFNLLPKDQILTDQRQILNHQDKLTNPKTQELLAKIKAVSQKYVRPDYESLSVDHRQQLLEQAIQKIQAILANPEIYNHLESKKAQYEAVLTALQQKLLAIAEYKKRKPDNTLPLLPEQENTESLVVVNQSGALTSQQDLQLPGEILNQILSLANDKTEVIAKELKAEPEKEVKKPSKIEQLRNKIAEIGKKYIPLATVVALSIGSLAGVNLLSKTGRTNVLPAEGPSSNFAITEIDNTKPPEDVGTYHKINVFVPKKDNFGRIVIEPKNISNEQFGRKVHFPNSTKEQFEDLRKQYPEARIDRYNLGYSGGYQIVPGYKPIALHSKGDNIFKNFDVIIGENGELINIKPPLDISSAPLPMLVSLPIQVLSVPIANTQDRLDSGISVPFSQNKLQQKIDDLKIRQESQRLMKDYDYEGFLAQIKDPKVRDYIDNLGKNDKGEISQKKLLKDLEEMFNNMKWGSNIVLSDDQNPKNTALNIIETFRIDENGEFVSTSPIICNQFADLGSFLWQIKTRNLAFVVVGGLIGKDDEYKLKSSSTHASSILEFKTLDGKSEFAQIDFTAESAGIQNDSAFESAIKQLYALGLANRNLAINLLLGAGAIGIGITVTKNGKTILKLMPKVPIEKILEFLQKYLPKFPKKKAPDSNLDSSTEPDSKIGKNVLAIPTSVLSGELAQQLKNKIQRINQSVKNLPVTEQTPLAKLIFVLASTSRDEDPTKTLESAQRLLNPEK
jgi:hypothetical protein